MCCPSAAVCGPTLKTLCANEMCLLCYRTQHNFTFVVCDMHCGNNCIYSPHVTLTKHHQHWQSFNVAEINVADVTRHAVFSWLMMRIMDRTTNTFYTINRWIHSIRKKEENVTSSYTSWCVYRPLNVRGKYCTVYFITVIWHLQYS